jgi:hypothetical protein
MDGTTIQIRQVTRERLKHQGRKGQTYDELINQLIDTTINCTENNQNSIYSRSVQSNPTTTGQSLARPGQSVGESIKEGEPS